MAWYFSCSYVLFSELIWTDLSQTKQACSYEKVVNIAKSTYTCTYVNTLRQVIPPTTHRFYQFLVSSYCRKVLKFRYAMYALNFIVLQQHTCIYDSSATGAALPDPCLILILPLETYLKVLATPLVNT